MIFGYVVKVREDIHTNFGCIRESFTSFEEYPYFLYAHGEYFCLQNVDFWVCSQIVMSRIALGFGHIREYL